MAPATIFIIIHSSSTCDVTSMNLPRVNRDWGRPFWACKMLMMSELEIPCRSNDEPHGRFSTACAQIADMSGERRCLSVFHIDNYSHFKLGRVEVARHGRRHLLDVLLWNPWNLDDFRPASEKLSGEQVAVCLLGHRHGWMSGARGRHRVRGVYTHDIGFQAGCGRVQSDCLAEGSVIYCSYAEADMKRISSRFDRASGRF